MFSKKLTDQFSKGLLDEVKKTLQKKEKDAAESLNTCEDYQTPVKVAGDTRQRQATIHGAKTIGTLKNKVASKYKKDGTLYKEEEDLPWKEDPKNPTRTTGTRKDEYGNTIKNVAKHLAKKAMKANEEVDLDEASSKIKSGNLTYGYHGSVEASGDEDREKKYSAMHAKVKKLVSSKGHLQDAKKPNVMVKHFLDSAHGRHIAGEPTDSNITSRFAHFKKTYKSENFKEEVEHNNCGTPECCGECNDVVEVAPPGKKFERMVKHIKKGYSKGGLTDQERSIAYATAWKAKKANEDIEIIEGIMHNRYERNHGKKARGTGSWAFTTKLYGSPKEHEMHFSSGEKTLRDAHAEAAKKLGTKHLYVMEEVEQIDELSKTTLRNAGGRMLRKGLEGGKDADRHMKSANLASAKLYPDQYKNSPLKAKVNATEEVEELDEISAVAKDAYVKKAVPQVHKYWHKSNVDADAARKYYNRKNTICKIANEEVEQIDELSKNKQYIEITHLLGHKKKVPVHPTNAYKALNHYRGLVSTKSARIVSEELDESFLTPQAHAELKNMPKDAVKRHLDTYMTTHKMFKKNGSHALAAAAMGAANEIKRKYMSEEAEQIDEISAKTKTEYAKKASSYIMNKAHSMNPDEVKKWNRRQKGMSMLKKEEAEQIDEISDKLRKSYHAMARGDEEEARGELKHDLGNKEDNKQFHAQAAERVRKRSVGLKLASKGMNQPYKEEFEQFEQDAVNLSAEEFEAKWLTPQVNELDEAFEELVEGRPKIMIQHPWNKDRKLHPVKDKELISKLRAKGYTNLGDRPSSENPINQLRKASTSMTGGHHVTLHTGEKHHVTGVQAARILDKHAGMKTAKEKLDYQDKLREKEFLQKEAGQ